MKPTVKLLAVFLLTAAFFVSYSPKAYVQPQQNYLQINSRYDWDQYQQPKKKKSSFFTTFCKTPFALVVALFTLGFLALSLVLEFGANVATGFSYKYPVSNDIKAIGWDSVTGEWWWNQSTNWHLWLSIFIWIVIANWAQKK